MEKDLVSVIIPVYNIDAYLPRCIETVLTQTYKKLEVILVNDGSTDNSGRICNDFAKEDNRVSVIHQSNHGLWHARNIGQEAASGEFLMFVDGDDYLHPDTIMILHNAIVKYQQADFAIINPKMTYRRDEQFDTIVDVREVLLSQEKLIYLFFNYKDFGFFNVWNKLYRSSSLTDLWAHNYPVAQDFDYSLRLYLRSIKAVWIHCQLYFWYQRASSLMHQPQYNIDAYSVRVKSLSSLLDLNSSNVSKYRHLFLKKIYRYLTYLKGRVHKTDKEQEIYQLCKIYENKFRKAYWLNWRINPLEKIVVTILLHNPRLTCWLMKKTKNY